MCGIAGIIDLAGQRTVPEGVVQRMSRALLHRGPDEEVGGVDGREWRLPEGEGAEAAGRLPYRLPAGEADHAVA